MAIIGDCNLRLETPQILALKSKTSSFSSFLSQVCKTSLYSDIIKKLLWEFHHYNSCSDLSSAALRVFQNCERRISGWICAARFFRRAAFQFSSRKTSGWNFGRQNWILSRFDRPEIKNVSIPQISKKKQKRRAKEDRPRRAGDADSRADVRRKVELRRDLLGTGPLAAQIGASPGRRQTRKAGRNLAEISVGLHLVEFRVDANSGFQKRTVWHLELAEIRRFSNFKNDEFHFRKRTKTFRRTEFHKIGDFQFSANSRDCSFVSHLFGARNRLEQI